MKKQEVCMLAGLLAVTMFTGAGCLLFAVGAAAGAGAGAVAYYENELCATNDVSLDRAWDAGNTAMKEMAYTIIPAETHKDVNGGVVQGRTAKDQVVYSKFKRRPEKTLESRLRVGMFATPDDRAAGQMLYDKMRMHF